MPSTGPEPPEGAWLSGIAPAQDIGSAGLEADGRPVIRVACGVLQRRSGEVLLAQRPAGKIAAGYWEFPGGKIESGEAPLAALSRELHEELGIRVEAARPLIRFRHAYSNRIVLLDTWLVSAYSGELQGREGQALTWIAASAIDGWPQCLPTVAPSLRALRLPAQYVFSPPDASAEWLQARLGGLPSGALLRLRQPALAPDAYEALAMRLLPAARAAGLRLVLDCAPARARVLGADGWHATAAALSRHGGRASEGPALQLASCHDAATLQRAASSGFDGAVLGAVRPTTTHPERGALGWEAFATAIQYAGLPVYALGGVGPGHLSQAFAAYAQGVAGISAYWPD